MPVNSPVTSFTSLVLSLSDLNDDLIIYSSIFCFCFLMFTFFRSLCSGESTINETPNIVSGLVVNTSIFFSVPFIRKLIVAPCDFPIQFFWVSLIDSDQSNLSRSFISRSAYAVILMLHCLIFFCSTGWAPLSENPFLISSFASTVPSSGHQFTIVSER